MNSDNQTDRVKEEKKKLKEEAEIRRLRYEARIEHLKDRIKHELKKRQAMEQAFDEVCQELFPGQDLNNLTADDQKKYEDLQDIYARILDSEDRTPDDE